MTHLKYIKILNYKMARIKPQIKINPNLLTTKYVKSASDNKFTSHLYGDMVVRASYANTLITIIFNTNNYERATKTVLNFIEKSNNPESLQFGIKIDQEDSSFEKKLKKFLEKLPVHIVLLSSPKGRGYIDLWQWVNFIYKSISKKSYFILNISDEMMINEQGWDAILAKYKGLESDHIFRLRTSDYKNRNYSSLFECGYAPDTTAIYTNKYLQIQGDFSPCFGPDNGQQFVAYYLSTMNYPKHYQFLRDRVINNISFSGLGTNYGLEESKMRKRQVINYLLWQNMFKHCYQENYFLRARKIQIEIIKSSNLDFSLQKFEHYEEYKRFCFSYAYKTARHETRKLYLSYKINKIKHIFNRLKEYNFIRYHTGYYGPAIKGFIYHFILTTLQKHPVDLVVANKKENLKDNYFSKFINFLFYPDVLYYQAIRLVTAETALEEIKSKSPFSLKIIKNEKINNKIYKIFLNLIKPFHYTIVTYGFIVMIIRRTLGDMLEVFLSFPIIRNIVNMFIESRYTRSSTYSLVLNNDKNQQSKNMIVKGEDL